MCNCKIDQYNLVTQDKESWDLNNEEKIEAAGKKKEEGNALFKLGKYARASKRYEKVLHLSFCSVVTHTMKMQIFSPAGLFLL